MIRVHVRQDVGLGRGQLGGVVDRREDVRGLEIDDAAEARDQMRAGEREPVEGEIGEADKHLGLGLALEIAPPRVAVVGRRRRAHQHDAGALQGIARLALVDHQRDPRIGQHVLGVHGEPRDQQQRRPIGGGRDVNQGAVGIAGPRHQRRQRGAAALAQKLLGGRLGVEIGCRLHRLTPPGRNFPLRSDVATLRDGGHFALHRRAKYDSESLESLDESRLCRGLVTFRPSFAGCLNSLGGDDHY